MSNQNGSSGTSNPPGNYQPRALAPVPAGGALALHQPETAGMVLAAQAKALVEARYTIALKQPRDIDVVRARLMKECTRPSFARVAIYRKPVGKGIEGPSIRFAEACLQAMSNILIDTPTIYDDAEKRIMRVSVADMETNVAYSKDVTIQKTVERNSIKDGETVVRQRTNSYGKPVYIRLATDDEILNTENALVSKALRTIGLRLIPGWLIEECTEAIMATRKKDDAANPDAAKNRLFDAFGSVGVDLRELKKWLGHDGAQLQPKEREELGGIYNAIKEGETTWQEVIEAKEEERRTEKKPATGQPTSDKSPGAGGGNQTSPKGDAAKANTAGEGKSPAAADAGRATGEGIAGGTAPQQTAASTETSPTASPEQLQQTLGQAAGVAKRGAAAVKDALRGAKKPDPDFQ